MRRPCNATATANETWTVCRAKTAFCLTFGGRGHGRGLLERIDCKQATQKGVPIQEITTGHNSNTRAKCWHVYSSGVHVAMIALHTDVPHRADHPWGDVCARLPLPNAQGHRAANDNGLAWPLIPFPINWYAAC